MGFGLANSRQRFCAIVGYGKLTLDQEKGVSILMKNKEGQRFFLSEWLKQ